MVNSCSRKNPYGSKWNPEERNVYICSEYFFIGKPHRKDLNHTDYVPYILRTIKSETNKLKLR